MSPSMNVVAAKYQLKHRNLLIPSFELDLQPYLPKQETSPAQGSWYDIFARAKGGELTLG
jgi:hypothetical protein